MYPDAQNLTSLAALQATIDPQIVVPSSGWTVTFIAVTSGGTGYGSAPTVNFAGGAGSGAAATAIVTGGIVTSIVITNAGSGFTSAPTISFSGGGGSGAAATAYIGPQYILQSLITHASSVIMNAIDLPDWFDTGTTRTEKRNGQSNQRMVMKGYPIISVSSVTIGTTVIPASDGTSDGWLVDDESIYLKGYYFSRGFQNVTIVYRWGIVAGSRQQAMLERACLDTCALWFKRRPHREFSTIAQPGGMGTQTFVQSVLPREAQLVIDQLRRPVIYA